MAVVKTLNKAAVLTALVGSQSVAMAQSVIVTYGPDVASVPTLSEWGMIIMSVLLAGLAVLALRKNARSKTILSIAVAALISFGVFSDSKWLGVARANGFPTYPMTDLNGGQVTISDQGTFAYVQNDTTIPLRIISVTPQQAQQTAPNSPACVPGLVVAPGTFCYVKRNVFG